MTEAALAASLLDALPQTQCTRCGYADCRDYADAIASGAADVNRCPPGGAEGVARLARIAGRKVVPLDPECGGEAPRALARIDEAACIGCALCLKACPTDAILGAATRMHTVVEDLCTGCELCVPVCPVDCIAMENVTAPTTGWQAWSPAQAALARSRYDQHKQRVARDAQEHDLLMAQRATDKLAELERHSRIEDPAVLERKRAVVAAALARARAVRKEQPPLDDGNTNDDA
jgi:electron transport complex protein RnfB